MVGSSSSYAGFNISDCPLNYLINTNWLVQGEQSRVLYIRGYLLCDWVKDYMYVPDTDSAVPLEYYWLIALESS